ncbi:MAG: recombinase family protein [Cyanobacteria bacterium J06642_3]
MPGYAPPGHKSPNPFLNLDRLDSELEKFLIEYHQTEHSQKMKIGYVCNFKERQGDPETSMVVSLQEAGCQKIFSDLLDFVEDKQPNLSSALEYAREGDILVIWDISAFSLDTSCVLDVMQTLQKKDISLQIISGAFSDIGVAELGEESIRNRPD